MTIYVDDLRNCPPDKGKWCHMMTDGNEQELHTFAQRIGCRIWWFQGKNRNHPHYDLHSSMREKAIAAGAVAVSSTEMVLKCSALFNKSGPATSS
jgi:hypothetical protein